jgi:putative transposase
LGLYDPEGRVPEFMRELNRLVAKHHNTMYGRRENLFSSDKYSLVRLESAIDVVRRLVYVLDNPVKAGLVDAARHWPGVISLPEHLATTKTVERPPLFFRQDGEMPETLELTYHKPDLFSHLSDEAYRAWIARMVTTREALRRRQREESGRKVLGRRAVLDTHHEDQPSSHEANFKPNPRVGAADPWRRIEAIQRLVGFLKQHAASWLRWKAGERDVVFPFGTYAMRVYHGAACAQAPPAPA